MGGQLTWIYFPTDLRFVSRLNEVQILQMLSLPQSAKSHILNWKIISRFNMVKIR